MPTRTNDKKAEIFAVEFLDEMIAAYYNAILEQVIKEPKQLKIGELLKMIELRIKQTPDDQFRKQFWEMIEDVRRVHLAEKEEAEDIDDTEEMEDNHTSESERSDSE